MSRPSLFVVHLVPWLLLALEVLWLLLDLVVLPNPLVLWLLLDLVVLPDLQVLWMLPAQEALGTG